MTAAEQSFAPARIPPVHGAWVCTGVELPGPNNLIVRFQVPETGERLDVHLGPKDMAGAGVKRLEHVAVRYDAYIRDGSGKRQAQAGAVIKQTALSVNERMAELARAGEDDVTIARAMGRDGKPAEVVFSRDSLRELLEPEIVQGRELLDGWTLIDVYPTSYLHEGIGETLELVLDFEREDDKARHRIIVAPKKPGGAKGFASTEHLVLSYPSAGGKDVEGADSLRAVVAFVLQLRDHPDLTFTFPDTKSDVQHKLLPAPEDESKVEDHRHERLNLSISTECNQQCAFCSVKAVMPAEDRGDELLPRLFADLESNYKRGVRHVRINGYDPLTYSRIRDVIERIRDLGYTRADVFSPMTTLADEEFCDFVVDTLPDKQRYHIPLYGMDPEVHDRVVSRKGAHKLVMRAIENLLARRPSSDIHFESVITKGMEQELYPMAMFARKLDVTFSAHMPYPTFESKTDSYFSSAARQSDVARAVFEAQERLDEQHPSGRRTVIHIGGMAPCVSIREARRAGASLLRWFEVPRSRPVLQGTEYRDEGFRHHAEQGDHGPWAASTVPCPHEDCALRSEACSGEFLRGYVELYGTEEFKPLSLREVVEIAREGEDIPWGRPDMVDVNIQG